MSPPHRRVRKNQAAFGVGHGISSGHEHVGMESPSPESNNGPISSNISESASDLPDKLIEFVLHEHKDLEPPRKRQKIDSSPSAAQEIELEHIVVAEFKLTAACKSSKLSEYDTPIVRSNIRPSIYWTDDGNPDYIAIVDDITKQNIYSVPIQQNESMQGIHLALLVDSDSRRWARLQGRLWTEFGVSLHQKNNRKQGVDCIELNLQIRWNTTSSPYNVLQAPLKTPALLQVLRRYFPDPNATTSEKWSPQDFYQSVHSTSKDEKIASTLKVEVLESTLYPFQKRAVQWLLRQEGVEWSTKGIKNTSISQDGTLPISFIRASDRLGRHCYVSHLFGIVTTDVGPFLASEQQLRGGILAEEMGLGKTVEMISLICLHKRPKDTVPEVFDQFTNQLVRSTAATLIIAPPSILQQWISEINKHAPHLKVMHYEGIKAHSKVDATDFLNNLASSDVVIATYSVLAAEINFTQLNPTKQLRRESKYPRPQSPIMQLSWWRILMDEAQMIESGVSKAAVVARMVPRVNAWCVTGTPVRKDVNDLLGLLVFLRHEPYASTKHIWSSLISDHKSDFRRLFGSIALRHSKQSVRDELKLPAQRRYVITMPFTPIEEQHYQELFNTMCEECGLDAQGAPLLDSWDPDEVSSVMQRWLVRLRQTVLHPEVGGRNRRALGQKDGPLRTVDQVLDVMMEQSDASIRADQRALLISRLKRGQLFENSPRVQEAFDIWTQVVEEAHHIVEECREQLRLEQEKVAADGNSLGKASRHLSGVDSDEEEQEEVDPSSRLGVFRMRLRGALDVKHMAIFFRANAYFQIKSNEEMTKPDTPEFEALEKLEMDGYEEAKKLRREILQEIFGKADKLMRKVSKRAATQTFVQVPAFPSSPPKGGIESRRVMEQLDALAMAFDAQAEKLDEWREHTVQLLLRSLVDEEEGVEITGDEYEDSTKIQDEVMVFVQVLRAVIADRHDALTGQENQLIAYDVKTAIRFAKEGGGPFPEKTIELLNERLKVKPTKDMGSIRGIVAELRALATPLRADAENGNIRAQNELAIIDKQLSSTQKQLTEQTKATAALEKEIDLFTNVMNTRLEYYRQLQQVSDMVAPYEGSNNERVLAKMLEDEEKLEKKIATARSKRRYLDHLKLEATNQEEQRICVICRETFEVGALTVCGHQYCRECIRLWWSAHRNCPICKRKLIQADLHEITYKPQELSIEAEEVHELHERSSPSSMSKKSAIYSEISKSKLAEIKNIELDGPSFTTKVDTLARHLMWLRETDPGAKSIIYSQFKDFLDVLARAFSRFRIGFASIDRTNGVERFKNDPGVECFLLHARAHSSGLNLVNASHVFLCEPLLQTALELQAIARVDRIGQHQETNVWLYLVDGTVEESIHQLSVKRRMEHIGQRLSAGKGKAKELSPDELLDTNLEEANSMELQQASLSGLLAKGGKGGEMIAKEDLWDCLFGGVGQRNAARTLDNRALRDPEIGIHLRAEAADERIAGK